MGGARHTISTVTSALALAAFICVVSVRTSVAQQANANGEITFVTCVTNETSRSFTAWFRKPEGSPNEQSGVGVGSDASCYRQAALAESAVSVALGETIAVRTPPNQMAEQFAGIAALPETCVISQEVREQANIENLQAVLLRVFEQAGVAACSVSVGVAPEGAAGLDAFQAMRDGSRPIYYESADRQSFALCVATDRRVEAAVWPQARPTLPSDFFPRADVVRSGGSGVPWCYRMWLRPDGDVVVFLGVIAAREMPNSPDFTEACTIGADLIAQARMGERQGVLVSVSRRRGQRQCEATLISAPERAIGLNAFISPPSVQSVPS